ncbi:hypothetical protein [Campylobacter troglodytis]|nr:hypothetical protein [Campylobacter troglodytis]
MRGKCGHGAGRKTSVLLLHTMRLVTASGSLRSLDLPNLVALKEKILCSI